MSKKGRERMADELFWAAERMCLIGHEEGCCEVLSGKTKIFFKSLFRPEEGDPRDKFKRQGSYWMGYRTTYELSHDVKVNKDRAIALLLAREAVLDGQE